MEMKKCVPIVMIIMGIILFSVGLGLPVPQKELTSSIDTAKYGGKSLIEEYVGGDAYNYIIGAALVGGEIAGVKAQKAIYISTGLLIACLGALFLAQNSKTTETAFAAQEEAEKTEDETTKEENEVESLQNTVLSEEPRDNT